MTPEHCHPASHRFQTTVRRTAAYLVKMDASFWLSTFVLFSIKKITVKIVTLILKKIFFFALPNVQLFEYIWCSTKSNKLFRGTATINHARAWHMHVTRRRQREPFSRKLVEGTFWKRRVRTFKKIEVNFTQRPCSLSLQHPLEQECETQ